MRSIADLSLGDAARVAGRYRPVVVSLGVLLGALRLLPGAAGGGADPDPALVAAPAPSPQAPVAAVSHQPPAAPAPTATGVDPYAFEPPSSGASFGGGAGAPVLADLAENPSPVEDLTQPAATAPVPLYVVEKAWASAGAGTPIATAGVPAGTLPVGRRAGQDDKRSFVRLAGTTSVLTLAEERSGTRAVIGQPVIRACQIVTSDWTAGEAMSFSQAPKHDDATCVVGTRSADGMWSFDLSAFDDPADGRGIALLPATGSPLDWQVAFRLA